MAFGIDFGKVAEGIDITKSITKKEGLGGLAPGLGTTSEFFERYDEPKGKLPDIQWPGPPDVKPMSLEGIFDPSQTRIERPGIPPARGALKASIETDVAKATEGLKGTGANLGYAQTVPI